MATTVARLEAVLGADTHGFDRAMGKSETKMQKAGKAAGVLGLALAGGLVIGAKHALNSASDLHEELNKTDVVFRGNQKVILEWSKHLAHSFGLSRTEALKFANQFGNMLVPMGLARKKAGEMSKQLVELAGDMASFNNASPEDTLLALQSGLAGQVRPLRQFGVFLSKTRVEAEAFATGIAKPTVNLEKLKIAQINAELSLKDYQAAIKEHGKGSDEAATAEAHWLSKQELLRKALAGQKTELTQQQKTLSAYQIIMKDTADTHGDFARTSEGVANQQRILRANVENLSASLGMALLPAAQDVTGIMNRMLEVMLKHPKAMKAMVIGLAALAAALLAAAAAQAVMNLAVLANPYVAATIAIIAFAAGVYILYTRVKQLQPVLEFMAETLIGVPLPLRLILAAMGGVHGAAEKLHTPIMKLADAFHTVVNWLEKVKDLFSWIIDNAKKIGGVFGGIKDAAGKIPGIGDVDPNKFKSVFAGGAGGGSGPKSINPALYDELSRAQQMGLHLTSGYRPGAVTKHGTRSDHSIYPSKAIDVADGPSSMARFFLSLIGDRGVKQAFYDPLGSIFGGVLNSYREGGHSDHVHVATYDQGGWLKPGWNLAFNGTGAPEPVGNVGNINLYVDGQKLFSWIKNTERRNNRRNSR